MKEVAMYSSLIGYTSLQQILQMIEYFDLPMDVRIFAALAAGDDPGGEVFPIYICEALGANQVGMLLAPSDPINAWHTLTLGDLVNACPDDCEIGECRFLTSVDGSTLMVAGGLEFREGKRDEIVMVFVPCADEPLPYTERTLH